MSHKNYIIFVKNIPIERVLKMSLEIFLTKYKAQLQALLPSSEVEYELSTENPIKFTDSENIKLAFACIADTHFSKKEYLAHNV
jgi:hypothetical protein